MKCNDSLSFLDAVSFANRANGNLNRVGASQTGDPHLSLDWFALLAETAMPSGARLALVDIASKVSEAKCFLPLMVLHDQPTRISGLSNFYSPLFGMVNEAAADSSQLEMLSSHLKGDPIGYAEVRFAPMDTDSSSYAMLKKAFRASGWVVDDFFCFGNWYQLVTPGDSTSYLAVRPSKLRNTLRRAERGLSRKSEFALDIIQEEGSRLDYAIAAFVEVYNRSWKQPEPFPGFIPGLCHLAAGRGWLRLGILRLGCQPLAAQLWLVSGKTAYIVKLAYDRDFSQFSAGTVLTAALCRHVIDIDRVEQIDYLIGDDCYKQDWMERRRERRGIIAYNLGRWRGWVGAVRHFSGKVRSSLIAG